MAVKLLHDRQLSSRTIVRRDGGHVVLESHRPKRHGEISRFAPLPLADSGRFLARPFLAQYMGPTRPGSAIGPQDG